MKNKIIIFTSVIGFLALFTQMYFTVNRKLAEGFSLFYSLNHFFSYFTIIINFSVAIFLLVYVLFPNSTAFKKINNPAVQGALAVYISIVGIIFYLLLYATSTAAGLESYASHVMHAYSPLAYLIIWFKYFRDSSLKYKQVFKWLIFPLFYFGYLLIRGLIVGKYPYFFVDAGKIGYTGVAGYAVAILIFFYVLGSGLVFLDRKFSSNKFTGN